MKRTLKVDIEFEVSVTDDVLPETVSAALVDHLNHKCNTVIYYRAMVEGEIPTHKIVGARLIKISSKTCN